jgi:uncharacterized membrane protein YeaQ/YmgE (transglycosylase-associated protein family)
VTVITFILVWLVIGLFMGVLASAVAHARHGLLFDSLLGLTGAVAAGLVFGAVLGYRAQDLITNSVIASLGAGSLLVLARLADRPRHGFR